MTYLEKLRARIRATGSALCVGLDVRAASADEARDFLREVIAQTAPHAAAYKPNAAYFEALGWRGMRLLEELRPMIPAEIPIILDVKRGDIGETQRYYAKACYDVIGADAVTLNPFMGRDTLEPFLEHEDKGIYLLAVTSNPGARDIEMQRVGERHVFELVCDMLKGVPQAGLVVGLTNASDDVLKRIPDVPLLIPGLGAQGGDLAALRGSNRSAPILVNVSRGISHAEPEKSFAEKARSWARLIAGAGARLVERHAAVYVVSGMRRRMFGMMLAMTLPVRRSFARGNDGSPAADRIRIAAGYSAATHGKSFLVLHEGRVLHEEYPNGFGAKDAHKIYSGTKAFWCLAALAAEEEGILRLKDRAADTITEWQGDRLKSRITIRQLLDFSSGLDPFFELHEDGIKDRDKLAVNRQLAAEPGAAFIYGPCSLQVFHEILKRKLAPRGQTPTHYLERHVLRPLGLGPQRYVADRSGNPLLAAGFLLNARQWAQMGKAVLNESNHVAPPDAIADACAHGSRVNAAFGLGFWNNNTAGRGSAWEVDVEAMLREKWPKQRWRNACLSRSAPSDLLASIGSGAQRLYVVPSRNLVIVRQGGEAAFSDAKFLRLLFGSA